MAPKKNELVTVEITDIGTGGEGIGRADGYTLFVKGAVCGDVVTARVLKAKKTYGYAKIERLLAPSPDRAEPVCPVAGRCGGCQLQQMSYAAQLQWKARKVRECLERIGGVEFAGGTERNGQYGHERPTFLPILGMKEPTAYRNKAQYPVGKDKNGRIVTGFYAGHTHALIPCDRCAIQAPVNEVICKTVCSHMEKYQIAPYDEATHTGLVRHILTRVGAVTGEVLVCLILNGRALPKAGELAERLKAAVEGFDAARQKNSSGCFRPQQYPDSAAPAASDDSADFDGAVGSDVYGKNGVGIRNGNGTVLTLKGVCLNINCKKTNVILGEEILPVWGQTYLTDYIGAVSYRISPLSFYQVNPEQTKVLYEKVLEFAGLTGKEIVWDLYCGIGTISLFLAASVKQVYGVEIVSQAIDDARENALQNGIRNAEFFVGAAEDVLPAKYRESGGSMRADVIVVDPPRKGCDERLLQTIVEMEPERLVYVSCDPATLARDVKYLGEQGYRVEKAQPVDMFPMTEHVESIVLLSHKSPDSIINVKVEFGDGEGKVPLDAIAERAKKYQPKPKITYKMIQEYVEKKYGFKVHTAYIAEVKKSLGLTMYDAPNAVKELKQPRKHPPKEKEEAIKAALKYFEVI